MEAEKPNKWLHNKLFEDVDVAVEGKMKPSDFWTSSDQDQAFITARKRAKATMEGYEHFLHEQEMKKESVKSKGKGKGK